MGTQTFLTKGKMGAQLIVLNRHKFTETTVGEFPVLIQLESL